jgi:DNA primase
VYSYVESARYPWLAWYTSPIIGKNVIVEDQLSAIRLVSTTGGRAIALLGTDLNQEKVSEIAKHCKEVTLALDKDATAKAFKLASLWGNAFEKFTVVRLEQDIKDMPPYAVHQMFR